MATETQVAPVWAELRGQPEAVEQLASAVRHKGTGIHHAWLFTGPPGSGRSNLAHAFATAILCEAGGCGTCKSCVMAAAGTHPDIEVLATERVQISIQEVRDIVANSYMGGSMGGHRILIIEDADRMLDHTANVLLKALEEPPANTIWMLCAPSEADLLQTIRSRVRKVGLKVPSVDDVAALLVERDGIDLATARRSAQEAQSHVGMARRLATTLDARNRRQDTLKFALAIENVTSAVIAAERWLDIAKKDADALTKERDAEEHEKLMQTMGLAPGDTIPPGLRSDFKNLEEAQKRRATRSLRDGIDRILVDLLALYRDVLMIQLQSPSPLVNEVLRPQIAVVAQNSTAASTIHKLEAIAQARIRIGQNVRDLLTLESLSVQLRTSGNRK
jgi:DNA polymerase-3 subunit delta'